MFLGTDKKSVLAWKPVFYIPDLVIHRIVCIMHTEYLMATCVGEVW